MTDNRTTELKPCPFCGGKAALRMSWMEDGHRYRAVECVECGATTPGNYSEVGDQSAWDWNARTPEQAVAVTLGEPIITCRDCRHATISTTGVCKYCEMFVLPDEDGYGADPQVNLPLDFFCGFAERKEVD